MSDLHPQGWYRATVKDTANKIAKTGTPMVTILFETNDDGKPVGTVFANLPFTDASMESSFNSLEKLGFAGDIAGLDEGSMNGTECWVKVKHHTYENVTRAQVSWINTLEEGPGGDGLKKDTTGQAAALLGQIAAKYRSARKAVDGVPF